MERQINRPPLDKNGFPVDAKKWTQEVAEILAENEYRLSSSERGGNKMMEREVDMPNLDEDGYLVDAKKWTKQVAEILAQDEVPTGLTENHWIVIAFIRQYYLEYKSAPPIRMIARRTGFTLRHLKELFPGGLLNTAWRYAGLPRNAVRPHFMYPRGDSWR